MLSGQSAGTNAVIRAQCLNAARCVFVAVDRASDFDVVEKALLNRAEVGTVQNKRLGVTATLAHSENGSLANRPATHVQLFVRVLVDLFAADERLIDFDDALELVEVFATSLSEPVKHKPGRALGDADLFRQLHRTDFLASGDYQIDAVNPLVERDMRTLEDSAGSDGEIKLAGIAAIVTALARGNAVCLFASRTGDAVRPKSAFQVEAGRLGSREHLE